MTKQAIVLELEDKVEMEQVKLKVRVIKLGQIKGVLRIAGTVDDNDYDAEYANHCDGDRNDDFESIEQEGYVSYI